jgi:hypothetical protein
LSAECGGNVAVCQLVVINPALKGMKFYYDLERPWSEIFAGCRVRFLQRIGASVETFEGWTLRGGDVLVGQRIVERRR